MQRLGGRVAIVTGAARGIGFAIAQRFAAEGATCVVADLAEDAVRAAAQRIPRAVPVAADVSAKADVARLVEVAAKCTGRIDVLVNNAGITHAAEFLDLAEEDFDRVLRVNLKSMFLCGQAVARHMVAQAAKGAIVNLSSVNAVLAIANQVPYVVSKGGINQLTRVMALGLAPHGIRVNAIGPGTIATEMAQQAVLSDDAARRKILSRTPLGRLGEPEEVAAVAAFLASDDASYLTGQVIYPDGGRMSLNYTVPVAE
ncbi:MAG: SDR family oxidoreductase [Betaproteobacteria bacterium]|jgi:glucose 1-dehydrogenase|nr:SDR family oxidoreductase [Betaproteobacteria bacterium]